MTHETQSVNCTHFMFYSSASVVKVFFLKQMVPGFPGPQQHPKYLETYNIDINQATELQKDLKKKPFYTKIFIQLRLIHKDLYTRALI